MKIAVFGSTQAAHEVQHPIADAAGIEQLCDELGKALAIRRHSIIVESDAVRTVDRITVDAILSAGTDCPAEIVVYHRVDHHRAEQRMRRPFADRQPRSVFRYQPIPQQYVGPAHLWMLEQADVVIVVGGGRNAYAAGLAAAFTGRRLIPVASFGGAGQQLWLDFAHKRPALMRGPRPHIWEQLTGHPGDVATAILDELESLPRIMIVHGRSPDREVLADGLTAYGVIDPIVLQQKRHWGATLPDKFEYEASQADAAIALFTPDDQAVLADHDDQDQQGWRARARQNVVLECGWFWGRLGRDRVMLLLKGELELPSDLAGVVYEHYVKSPSECEKEIRDFIDAVRGAGEPA